MPDSRLFQLDRLYFGTLVDAGRRVSTTPGVIARTPNITPAHVAECLRMAQLVPPSPDESTEDMPGALALFRGEATDFILTKSQRNNAGFSQILYILMPVAPLRWLGGNIQTFRSLAMMDMPSFSAIKNNLLPFDLRDPAPPAANEQIDALNDLLLYCRDSFKNLEGLLAGLVQGMPLAIINSPAAIDQRLRFIQGLLCLLPVPARVGITFATHVQDPLASPVQLKFFSRDVRPANHLIYNWSGGRLESDPPSDSYSHYIVSQMRLDLSLVVEQTEKLSRTTVWRAMHKDNLGRALAWVSRRGALDQTVIDGQPADRATVAAVLREDPTLSDDLRLAYARHLLAFSLALNELEPADVIPSVAVTSQDITETITTQLRTAIESGQAQTVFALLERWLLHVPETSPVQWTPIFQQAVKRCLLDYLENDRVQEANDFITRIKSAHPSLHLDEITPALITAAQPRARTHPPLAETILMLAAESLPAGDFQRLLSDRQFTNQLPEAARLALTYLEPEPRHPAPPHVLEKGARVFSSGYRMLLLARLVEWAVFLNRPELVDTAGLQSLLVLAQSPRAERFETLIQHIIDDFSQVSAIQVLEPPGPRVLIQLCLQTNRFTEAVRLLEFYQNAVFRPERLADFTQLANEVCLMTPLTPEQLEQMLKGLEGSQIRPEPRAAIYSSALVNRNWADDQQYAAGRLTHMLFNDNTLIKVVGHENVIKLLGFYARQRNAIDSLRIGAALVDSALTMGTKGTTLVIQMWPLLNWGPDIVEAAIELLRRYLRGVPLEYAPRLLTYFREQLGAEIVAALQATYLMRRAMGGSGLMRFADDVHTTAQLLVDIATTYHINKEPPPNHRLRRDLDTMTGGLSDNERKQVADNTHTITHQMYRLGHERSQKQKNIEELLIQTKAIPRSGVDLLRFVGGHFAHCQSTPLNLEREAMTHIFGNRSAAMFLRETEAITRLLNGLRTAFQDPNALPPSPEALIGELESLWSTLSLYNQRRIQDQFAQDCQHLAEALSVIADRSNERVLTDSGPGRQLEIGQRQPRTALEAMRWINGYFARKHTRSR